MSFLIFSVPAFVAGSQTRTFHLLRKNYTQCFFQRSSVELPGELGSGLEVWLREWQKKYLQTFFMTWPALMGFPVFKFLRSFVAKGGMRLLRKTCSGTCWRCPVVSRELFRILPACPAIRKQKEWQAPELVNFGSLDYV